MKMICSFFIFLVGQSRAANHLQQYLILLHIYLKQMLDSTFLT